MKRNSERVEEHDLRQKRYPVSGDLGSTNSIPAENVPDVDKSGGACCSCGHTGDDNHHGHLGQFSYSAEREKK